MYKSFLKFNKNIKGFTLIELLVVVAIIGILSGVVLASLNSAREKARDTRRKSDLKHIQTALELHYGECGTYIISLNCSGVPYGNTWNGGITYGGWFNINYGSGSVAQGLVDRKLTGSLIIDPTNNTTGAYSYMIISGKDNYTIWATIVNPSSLDTASISKCYYSDYDNYSGSGKHNYCVSS